MVENESLFQKMSYEIEGFEYVDFLGEGTFGQVFLMREKSQDKLFRAVKILHPSAFVLNKTIAEKRFQQEILCLDKLRHPSIVSYIASGWTSDKETYPYLVMEYVAGPNIFEFSKSVPSFQKARLVLRVLDALSYAHTQGVYHRDIKPSNVIIRDTDKTPVIVDFGLSYLFEGFTSQTLTTSAVGTLGYIPPEVIEDPKLRSPLHDIYSCGVLLYSLFALRLPNFQDYKPLSSIEQSWAGLDLIIRQAAASVEKRFATPSDFAERLSHWIRVMEVQNDMTYDDAEFKSALIKKKKEKDERVAAIKIHEETRNILVNQALLRVRAVTEVVFRNTADTLSLIMGEEYRLEISPEADPPTRTPDKTQKMFGIIHTKYNEGIVIGKVSLGNQDQDMKIEELVKWSDVRTMGNRYVPPPPKSKILPIGWIVYIQSGNMYSLHSSLKERKLLGILAIADISKPTLPITFYVQGSAFVGLEQPTLAKDEQELSNFMRKPIQRYYKQ